MRDFFEDVIMPLGISLVVMSIVGCSVFFIGSMVEVDVSKSVHTIRDEKNGVSCYVYEKGGISCVRDWLRAALPPARRSIVVRYPFEELVLLAGYRGRDPVPKAFRPTGNVLEGYEPSTSINRFQQEAS